MLFDTVEQKWPFECVDFDSGVIGGVSAHVFSYFVVGHMQSIVPCIR